MANLVGKKEILPKQLSTPTPSPLGWIAAPQPHSLDNVRTSLVNSHQSTLCQLKGLVVISLLLEKGPSDGGSSLTVGTDTQSPYAMPIMPLAYNSAYFVHSNGHNKGREIIWGIQ